MQRPPRLTAALLAALTGCADDSAGDASASASATTSASTSASGGTTTATTSTSTTDALTTSAGATEGGGDTAITGETSESATASTGESDTSTTGGDDDPVSASAPSWLRALDGLNSLAPPRVVPLPDGDVLALISGGLYAKEIVLAEGDADETVLATMYVAPALARFDGASGALKTARMLAKLGQGTQYGMSVQTQEVELASNGDLLVAGTWFGAAEFFPGTGDSETMVAEIKLNGNNLDRAEEPFFYRMTPDGGVTWLIRGRTPPAIETTWFNFGKGIAALPGGDVVIAGDYELPGFVVAHGTAGAKTMSGSQSSYFARLGADGSPTWAHRNSQRLPYSPLLRSGADGALYSLLPADATIFADADAPTMTVAEPGLSTLVLGRVAASGGLEWTVNVARAGSHPLRGFEVTEGGDLLLFGDLEGELLLRDAGGAVTGAQSDAPEGWIAGLSPAGEGLWIRTLGPTVSLPGPTLAGHDGVWLVAQIAAPYELAVAGVVTSLPALGYGPESTATALLRIDPAGEVTAAQVVGADLQIDSLAWSGPDQGAFLVTGGYWCDSIQPHVVSDGGDGLAALASACEMKPLDDQRGYVAAVPRTP